MKFFRLTALPAFLLLATSITAVAQVNTATIYGEVTDPSQAATPGAQLHFRNQLTGTVTSTKSNESNGLGQIVKQDQHLPRLQFNPGSFQH